MFCATSTEVLSGRTNPGLSPLWCPQKLTLRGRRANLQWRDEMEKKCSSASFGGGRIGRLDASIVGALAGSLVVGEDRVEKRLGVDTTAHDASSLRRQRE